MSVEDTDKTYTSGQHVIVVLAKKKYLQEY